MTRFISNVDGTPWKRTQYMIVYYGVHLKLIQNNIKFEL